MQLSFFFSSRWCEAIFSPNHAAVANFPFQQISLRAVCAISMHRAKNRLPIVTRQFLSLSYPLCNRPFNCPSHCRLKWFNPWKFAEDDEKLSLKLSLEYPRGEGNWTARQGQKLSCGNFAPQQKCFLTGPLGCHTLRLWAAALSHSPKWSPFSIRPPLLQKPCPKHPAVRNNPADSLFQGTVSINIGLLMQDRILCIEQHLLIWPSCNFLYFVALDPPKQILWKDGLDCAH